MTMYQSRFCSPTRRTECESTSECRMSLYAVARDCFVALSASAGRILPRTRTPEPPNAPAAHYERRTHACTTSATSSSYRTRSDRWRMPISLFIVSIRARLISDSGAMARLGRFKVEVDGDVDGDGIALEWL